MTLIIYIPSPGWIASDYCAKNLIHCVVKKENERLSQLADDADEQLKQVWGDDNLFTEAYLECDKNLKEYHISQNIQPELGAGCTCISVYCRFATTKGTPHEIVCTNVGDSRAILYDGSTSQGTFALSEDQKPTNEKERQRIINAGKTVSMGRVMGNLAVARAFGDFRYKNSTNVPEVQQAVCVEPEITRYQMTPVTTHTNQKYQFVVLACDGLWDKMTNTDVSSYICQHLDEYKIFDESVALTSAQMEPLQTNWLHKFVADWENEDVTAWYESIPTQYRRHFRNLLVTGNDLINTVANEEKWNMLMKTKEGIGYVHEFKEETGVEFRKIVLDRIADNEDRLTNKKAITSTVDKLTFLTERLIDYVVFKKRSEDNVSVTIVLLKPE